MKRYSRLLLPGMLAAFFTAGCIPSNQDDINTLYQRVNQHDQQIRTLSSQNGQNDSMLSGQAEVWAQVQSMRQDLNGVKGQLDEINMRSGGDMGNTIAQLQSKTAKMETALRQMAAELGLKVEALDALDSPAESAPGVAPGVAPGSAAVPAGTLQTNPGAEAPATVQAGTSDRAAVLYDSGTKAFSGRRYKDGIKIFDEFVATYPTHSLTSNAYFWQGECYFQLGDFARAALAYNNVLEKFPASSKYQSAMLKQGMALYGAGKKDGGKVRLNELITKYPKSAEAARAKKYLQENP